MNTPKTRLDPELDEEYQLMAEKIRSGEYFEESRYMYDVMVHDLMAERYLYIFITILSVFIFLISYMAKESLYPLNNAVPYVFYPDDVLEDLPHMEKLNAYKGEDPSEGVLRYLVANYVRLRENYSVEKFDRNVAGVKNQSTDDVVQGFQQAIDPRNPESPIAIYQRHSKRDVNIVSYRRLKDQDFGMEVIYDATVTGQGEIRRSRWKANIAFQYSGVTLDESGKPMPLTFMVTRYETKRLQESQ